MAITVKFRRGSTAQSNSFLGQEGELYIDKDKDTVVVHDGVTVGGFPLASEAYVTQAISNFGTSSFSGDYNDLTNKPVLFSGSYNDLTDKPTIPTVPTLASVATTGSYNDLTDKPVLFSGSYNDLTDKPTIPSLAGYATESYVQTQVANVVDSAPATLNTLNELAQALGDDANFATTISTQIGLKANTADLSAVATTGSYNDLTNKPVIPTVPTSLSAFTNDTNYITRTGISVSGSLTYNSVTGVINYTEPALATVATTGSYNDLTNKPTIPTNISAFTNDSNYVTQSSLTNQLSTLSFQPLNNNLTILATNGFGTGANKIPQFDSNGWLALGPGNPTDSDYRWRVRETVQNNGTTLDFAFGPTNLASSIKMRLDFQGNLTVTGNITAYGFIPLNQ